MIDAIQTGADYLHSNFTGIGYGIEEAVPGFILAQGDLQFDDRSRRNVHIQNPSADRYVKRRSLYRIRILEGVVCVHVAVG